MSARSAPIRKGPAFPGDGTPLVTATRSSSISVTRFAPRDFEPGFVAGMPQEGAHLILFQLQDHPAHDFWVDGKYLPAEASEKGTVSIFDLADIPCGRLTDPVDTLMFHLPQATLDEMAEDLGAPKVTKLQAAENWTTHDAVLQSLQGLVIESLAEPGTCDSLLQDHLMLGIAGHLAQTYGGLKRMPARCRGGLAPWQANRAKELLAANLNGDLSLQDVADECQLSLAHFAKAFKTSVGSTPHCWLQERRIAMAKDLMQTTDIALADIALACGFADQSHFTRIFARSNGVGPGAWRKMLG